MNSRRRNKKNTKSDRFSFFLKREIQIELFKKKEEKNTMVIELT